MKQRSKKSLKEKENREVPGAKPIECIVRDTDEMRLEFPVLDEFVHVDQRTAWGQEMLGISGYKRLTKHLIPPFYMREVRNRLRELGFNPAEIGQSPLPWTETLYLLDNTSGWKDEVTSISDDELEILWVLDDNETLRHNKEICDDLKRKEVWRSLSTVKVIVNRLIEKGLVVRPSPRSGVCITPKGKARIPPQKAD